MRVIAGSARRLLLKAPLGDNTRPTTDRIKETLFNMIQNEVPGSVFLDLFAGSGAIGIEALSRGADYAVFVENDKNALTCIEENLKHTGLNDKAGIYKQDVFVSLQSLEYKYEFDIVFMDPPYDKELERRVLEYLTMSKLIHEDTLIIFEASLDTEEQKMSSKAIYPGSFDPMTYGHMDIIRRSAEIFDELTVSVLNNVNKTALFSVEERVNILIEATKDMKNVKVESFQGLLIDYARSKNIHVVIRGLRAITDFEYELQIAQTNRKLSGETLDTMFLTTSLEYAYLSSSSVKEIASFGGNIEACVPDFVAKQIYDKYKVTR